MRDGNRAPKVLFVIGKGRSGSTLLDLTLGATEGFFSLMNCETPIRVPVVPMPATKTSISPSVWAKISGPVVS